MTRVAIAGYAQSPIVRNADTPLGELAVQTVRDAIADAGLAVTQIDGFTTGSLLPAMGDHASRDGVTCVTSDWVAQQLGVNPRFAAGFQGHGQLSGATMLAVQAVATGAADYVVLHRALHNPAGRYHQTAMAYAEGDAQWVAPQGLWGPLAMIALPYNEYLQRYGGRRETMAKIVVEARRHGARIPWSVWHDRPLTEDEYLAAPTLADPICRFDCDLPVDGVAAFVFTTEERARDLPHPPVFVAGYAQGHPTVRRAMLHWTLDDIMGAGNEIARRLWRSSGLSRADIDVPQLYDGFAPFIYFWLESLGYCGLGEAHALVDSGGIEADAGGLPVLTGGGALGNGRMHGVPQLLECYLQLSGRAGERQRVGVHAGLACHSSPHFGGVVAYTNV